MYEKVFVIVAAAVFLLTSCKDAQFGIEYSLQSVGKADGNVSLIFGTATFTIDGTTTYDFKWSNADIPIQETKLLSQALESKDAKTLEAAKNVDSWVDSMIDVTSLEGSYDVYVKGYVREVVTGITFSIDRHFTNLPDLD